MAADATGSDFSMLNHDELKQLALLLRNAEEPLMNNAMKSENDRAEYIKSVNDSYQSTISLLDDSKALGAAAVVQGSGGGEEKASIARDITSYVQYSINFFLQDVRNCALRASCVQRIRAHYDALVRDYANLHPENVPNVRRMAMDTFQFKENMWRYCNNHRSASARALSRAYSMMLREEGVRFPDLVNRQRIRLGYAVEFEQLGDAEKVHIYNSIITDSGRVEIPKLEIASGAVGIGVLVVTAGLMVWDIFTAEDKIEAVLHNGLVALSGVGAFFVQVSVEASVTTAVADMGAGVFLVSLAGFVAGLAAGIIFIAASGSLVDLIIGSGGSRALPVSGLKFHSATMPDGMALANELAHRQ